MKRFTSGLGGMLLALGLSSGTASAQIFEIIHPDVDKGGFEFESLNGVTLGSVETGEERSAHEIALGYAPLSFWKTTFAVEIANPEDEDGEYEGFEWENVLLFPFGSHWNGQGDAHGHGHGHDHDDEAAFGLAALGLFFALEVPNDGGIDSGAAEFGPLVEFNLGPVNSIINLFVEYPFEDEEDPGLAYGVSAAVPVGEVGPVAFDVGAEAHGGFDGAFGDAVPSDENTHVIGPALYSEVDIGRDRVLEPRVAALFGLTDGSPDAVLSFNIELKF